MASSLNCPTCGAAASGPDAIRCEYCGSTLTSVACPACFGTMFAGMEFCPHCGAKAARVVDEGATLSCPGCRGQMKNIQVGTTPLFECPQCAGTWVAAGTFTQLCQSREERGAIAAMNGSAGIEMAVPPRGTVRYVPCPLCHQVMNRENFGHRSGVIVDVCKGHGVWFDRGELQAVMNFIGSGGLERARQIDIQNHAEEERLEALRESGGSVTRHYESIVVNINGKEVSRSESSQDFIGDAIRRLFG